MVTNFRIPLWECVNVCVCVCVSEREREREREKLSNRSASIKHCMHGI